MSGFLERLVEDWLTKSDERAYQLPFAAMLAKTGQKIAYVSPHSILEEGKDLITVTKRRINAYQLKAGNVSKNVWRSIRDEVWETSAVPISMPGLPRRTPDAAFLVLTGSISEGARHQIALLNHELRTRQCAEIETIELPQLVADFTAVFETFLPASIEGLHGLVRLYLQDGTGPQDKASLASILGALVEGVSGPIKTGRALSNIIVAAGFASTAYRRTQNHISVLDTWTVAAAYIMASKADSKLGRRHWQHQVELCEPAIDDASQALSEGISERTHFVEGNGVFDIAFIQYRRLVVLGYVAAAINSRAIRGTDVKEQSKNLLDVLLREIPLAPWSEGSWNYYLNIVLALRHTPEGNRVAENLVSEWMKFACPARGAWPEDPYTRLEDHVSLSRQRKRATYTAAHQERARVTYSGEAAIDYLARRLARQAVARRWRSYSRFDRARLRPSGPTKEFTWEMQDASLELYKQPLRGSWSALRQKAFSQRSSLIGNAEAWLLPYFLCAYPHRVSPLLSGELDFQTSPPEARNEWRSVSDLG